MFANACELGNKFTRPVVIMTYCVDGICRPSVGSFVVVNNEGWFLSAWHIGNMIGQLSTASSVTRDHQAKIAAVKANAALSKGNRKQVLRQLGEPKDEAPLAFAVWWSWDGVQAVDVSYIAQADLMLGRLTPFDSDWIKGYPVFKDPAGALRQGTSLCRLGYPFPSVSATYDAATGNFNFTQIGLPTFPIEGILTRTVELGANAAGYHNRFIETSSPGLKGQSGGPMLDTSGAVWGIQSNTRHLSLGFDPEVPAENGRRGGGTRKEHQFLNVGWATHPETTVGLLREKGVSHAIQP